MKKIISTILVCCMVLPFFPASATENTVEQPTIQEILNDYHSKAFEAQTAQEEAGTYSRSASGTDKTLEQETVDELTAAGYEAYNVTGDNYDALEASLQTDLEAMGLSRDGSYVVVIHGAPSSSKGNPNARVIDPPAQDYFDGDGSTNFPSFIHTYNDKKYTMRYVTVTGNNSPDLVQSTIYNLSNIDNIYWDINGVDSTFLVSVVDSITPLPLASIFQLIFPGDYDEHISYVNPSSLALHAMTAWTRQYVQVYREDAAKWHTSQFSAYATSKARCVGYIYHPTNLIEWYNGTEQSNTIYSPLYHDTNQRLNYAASAFITGVTSADPTGDISFFLVDSNKVAINQSDDALFVHEEYDGLIYVGTY